MQKIAKKTFSSALIAGALLLGASTASADTSTSSAQTSMQSPLASSSMDMHSTSSGALPNSQGENTYTVYTYGHNEVPKAPDMTDGRALLMMATTGLHYMLQVRNGTDMIGAHLHCAPAGQNGPVIATLYHSMDQDLDGTLATGTVTENDILPSAKGCSYTIGYEVNDLQDLMRAISGGYVYVNMHSADYPDGISRGQIMGTSTSSGVYPPPSDQDNTDSYLYGYWIGVASSSYPGMTQNMPSQYYNQDYSSNDEDDQSESMTNSSDESTWSDEENTSATDSTDDSEDDSSESDY